MKMISYSIILSLFHSHPEGIFISFFAKLVKCTMLIFLQIMPIAFTKPSVGHEAVKGNWIYQPASNLTLETILKVSRAFFLDTVLEGGTS